MESKKDLRRIIFMFVIFATTAFLALLSLNLTGALGGSNSITTAAIVDIDTGNINWEKMFVPVVLFILLVYAVIQMFRLNKN